MTYSHYSASHYSAENFAADESFQAFVFSTNADDVAFWTAWLAQHPEKQPQVEQAIQLLKFLSPRSRQLPASVKEAEVKRLLHTIQLPVTYRKRQLGRTIPSRIPFLFRIAAVFIGSFLLAGIAYWQFVYAAPFIQYATPYAQTKTIQLPDGSTVMLNAHSSLKTHANWDTQHPREVWLQGEAFFSVKKRTVTSSREGLPVKFIVHTDDLDVEVVGTRFNVKNRSGRIQVVLNSGKVQLSRHTWLANEKLVLKPGELAEYSGTQSQLIKKTVNPTAYSSWISRKLIFNKNTLAEVIQLVKETYGLRVEVDEPALLNQEVTGSIPNPNAEVLLDALSKSLDLKITRTGNQVTLQRAH